MNRNNPQLWINQITPQQRILDLQRHIANPCWKESAKIEARLELAELLKHYQPKLEAPKQLSLFEI